MQRVECSLSFLHCGEFESQRARRHRRKDSNELVTKDEDESNALAVRSYASDL